jgi:hypothetical protein
MAAQGGGEERHGGNDRHNDDDQKHGGDASATVKTNDKNSFFLYKHQKYVKKEN